MTLVIALMLTLSGVVMYSIDAITEWQKGRAASEQLKAVYIAQKSYLADHPTKSYTQFTSDELIPYLPNRPGAMPTTTGENDEALALKFNIMPPEFRLNGSTYDPSDSTEDGLWDVGKL